MSRPRSLHAALVAVAVIALFVISSFAAVASTHSSAASRVLPQGARNSIVGTDTIQPLDAGGVPDYDFSTGYDNGNVYFFATDTAGDLSARVSINDLNASRDGLTNPLATWNVSFAAGTTNDSAGWGGHYLLPLSLIDGGLWNVTITGHLGGTHATQFYVHTYTLQVEAQSYVVLPGQGVVLDYQVVSTANGGPYNAAAGNNGPTSAVTSIQVNGRYLAQNLTSHSWFGKAPDSASPAAWGSFTAPMPVDVLNGSTLYINLWANVSSANVNTTDAAGVAIGVGSLTIGNVGLSLGACPNDCVTSSFEANDLAYLLITATVEGSGGDVPAAGLSVTIHFVGLASTELASIGSPSTQLTLNATGQAGIVFTASPTAFAEYVTHTINVTVFNPAVANTTVTAPVTFQVLPDVLATPNLVVSFAEPEYQSGDSAVVSWALGAQNATVTTGWTVSAWYTYLGDGTYGPIQAWGTISSQNLSGTFPVAIPANYTGFFAVSVEAYNATETISSHDVTAVLAPTIELTPSEVEYNPGDTVTVHVVLDGASLTGATVYAYVYGNDYVFEDGVLAGSTISVQVPKVGAPTSITFEVTAVSTTLGVLTSQILTLDEAYDYELIVSVPTTSKYTDGSFQPGETITVNYHLLVVGLAQTPTLISLDVASDYFEDGPEDVNGAVLYQSLPISGSVSYTIPSSLPSGTDLFYIYAEFPSAVCNNYYDEESTPGLCEEGTIFTLTVNSNPSTLEYQVVPNSGLTLGWLILLVLIVVVGLVLWLSGRRRGGSKPSSFSSTSSTSSSADSAASTAGTGASGPAPWQPPSSGGSSGSPPLPNPPSGPGSS